MNGIDFDYWLFIAGLGIFLFGMYHLENGLKGLAGKSFKRLLQKFTNKSWKGILTGTFVTAILQSSSLVNLLALAFLGGGIISLHHSLGVVLGANLGTTFTAWIVATLGFKLNVAELSFPLLAMGVFSYLLFDKRPFLKNLGTFLMGFGLLFLGLDYMKLVIEEIAAHIDLTQYASLGLWVFLLIGLVVTGLIQSSSAMIVIVLSALNAGIIDLHQSVAMIIGSSIGTTSTIILGSINGSADKKRLSLANIIFKTVAGIVTFVFIDQLIFVTVNWFNIKEPLMELVFLNTMINVIGIVIFYPFLTPFTKLLNQWFQNSEPKGECKYIRNAIPDVPDVAIKALDQELKYIFELTHDFMLSCLRIRSVEKHKSSILGNIVKVEINPIEKYNQLKQMEDEITEFYTQIQEQNLTEEEASLLAAFMLKLRAMISAAKNIKDVVQNIRQIDESEDVAAREILKQLQEFTARKTAELKQYESDRERVKPETEWHNEFELFYNKTIENLYRSIKTQAKRDVPVSTITNAIKKTVSALEELAHAVSNRRQEEEALLIMENKAG
jgi:phosphate:Na+ symporter